VTSQVETRVYIGLSYLPLPLVKDATFIYLRYTAGIFISGSAHTRARAYACTHGRTGRGTRTRAPAKCVPVLDTDGRDGAL